MARDISKDSLREPTTRENIDKYVSPLFDLIKMGLMGAGGAGGTIIGAPAGPVGAGVGLATGGALGNTAGESLKNTYKQLMFDGKAIPSVTTGLGDAALSGAEESLTGPIIGKLAGPLIEKLSNSVKMRGKEILKGGMTKPGSDELQVVSHYSTNVRPKLDPNMSTKNWSGHNQVMTVMDNPEDQIYGREMGNRNYEIRGVQGRYEGMKQVPEIEPMTGNLINTKGPTRSDYHVKNSPKEFKTGPTDEAIGMYEDVMVGHPDTSEVERTVDFLKDSNYRAGYGGASQHVAKQANSISKHGLLFSERSFSEINRELSKLIGRKNLGMKLPLEQQRRALAEAVNKMSELNLLLKGKGYDYKTNLVPTSMEGHHIPTEQGWFNPDKNLEFIGSNGLQQGNYRTNWISEQKAKSITDKSKAYKSLADNMINRLMGK